jgi:predicted SAM-dependent methyltransferase
LLPEHAKVQLGCGEHRFDGWVNIDINRAVHPDVRLDLRGGFPAPAESVAFVFSEHVFEHLTLDYGRLIFADCFAALEQGGVMRIAMPDLRYIVERYMEGRYEGEGGPEAQGDAEYRRIDSPALLLNYALRSWGHRYLYDLDELDLRLRQAGFAQIDPQEMGKSLHPELARLEQRGESRLIVEATK